MGVVLIVLSLAAFLFLSTEAAIDPCQGTSPDGCKECLARSNGTLKCFYCGQDDTCYKLEEVDGITLHNCSNLDYYVFSCDVSMLVIIGISAAVVGVVLVCTACCCCCIICCCCCKKSKRMQEENQPLFVNDTVSITAINQQTAVQM